MNRIKLGIKFDQERKVWKFGWIINKKFLALGKSKSKEKAIEILTQIHKERNGEYPLVQIKN
jgi:hypothetical protein